MVRRRARLFPLPVDGILLAITLALMALTKLFPPPAAEVTVNEATIQQELPAGE